MKTKTNTILSGSLKCMLIAVMVLLNACIEDEKFAEDYDIKWPTPYIDEMSTNEAFVDEIVTLSGSGLEHTTSIRLNGQECPIVPNSATSTEIKFQVARRAKTGMIELENKYRRDAISSEKLIVKYPEVTVTKWPAALYVGKSFTIEGENVDLITQVIVKDSVVDIVNPTSTTKIVVPTNKFNLMAGETVSIKVISLGPIDIDEVTGVPVEAEVPLPNFKQPVVLWTFEDGDPIVTSAGNAPTTQGRNLGGLSAQRGENYYSVTKTQTGGWTNFIYIEKEGPFNLTEFNDPHLTFLVNTNGKRGYVNPFFTQGGSEADNHFNNGTASAKKKYNDDYAFQTNGWEWRSYPISKLFAGFGATGTFDRIRLRFTSGNVGNGGSPEDYEIHIDQVMITDGLQLPTELIWDFEDGAYTWDNNLSPTHGINLSAVLMGAGEKFLTVQKAAVSSWQWQGAIVKNQTFVLSENDDPHISFLINTGNKRGYVQIEVFQNATKWGGNSETQNYLFDTHGQWQSVSLRLKDILGNWGGDAAAFDPTASLDYVKIGFTTGNVDGTDYEVNIDDVYISDGGMW